MWYKLQPMAKAITAGLLIGYLALVIVRIAAGIALYPHEVEIAVGLLVGAGCAWFWIDMTSNPRNARDELIGQYIGAVVIAIVWSVEVLTAGLVGDGWVSAGFTVISSVVALVVGLAVWKEVEEPQPAVKPLPVSTQDAHNSDDVDGLERQGP